MSNDGDVFGRVSRVARSVRARRFRSRSREEKKECRNAKTEKRAFAFRRGGGVGPANEGIDVAPARAARARVLEPRPSVFPVRDARSRTLRGMLTCRPRPSCVCPRSRARRLSRRPYTVRSPPRRDAGAGTLSDCAICPSAGRPCGPCDGAGRGWERCERGVRDVVSRRAKSCASSRLRGAPARPPGRAFAREKTSTRASVVPDARLENLELSAFARVRACASAACERTEGNARRLPRGVAGRARARSAGHALEHFEVHVVSHLLPGADAVLLHGVAQRLLLRGVPVPSEGHLRRLAPRLGLRLGFHRAVRAARCGPGAIQRVRAQSATPLESERTRPTRSPRRELLPPAARANLSAVRKALE